MNVFQKSGIGTSLKRKVYDDVFTDILFGRYKPDTHITEKELVDKYNISKSPIREALIELCNEGVLRSIPRYGYEVIKIGVQDIEEAKEYRIILECGALDRYWDEITNDQIENILRSQNTPARETNILDHWNTNSQFHLDLASTYNNTCIYKALESSLKLMTRAYVQFQMEKWKQPVFIGTSHRHRDVLAFIKEGNKAAALQTLKTDIEEFVIS